MIATDVLDSEEASEYGSIDNYVADSYEEDDSGLVEAGVRTGVPQLVTEDVEEVQGVVKYFSLLSYMLKPPSLLAQGFKKNNKAQENLFNHMCHFGVQAEWGNGRISVSSYLDVDIRNDQDHLVNLTPLDCISGFIIEYSIGDRALNKLPQQRLNLIDVYISSYCSILNSPKRIGMINQANELAYVLCDIEYYHLW